MALTNRQKVLQLANTIGGRIKDEKFFLSLQVKRFMEQKVMALTKRYNSSVKVPVNILWSDPEETAWTDHRSIFMNANCDLMDGQTRPVRFLTLQGFLFHETAHILYTDSNYKMYCISEMTRENKIFPEPNADVTELNDFLSDGKHTASFVSLWKNIWNSLEDGYIEYRFLDEHTAPIFLDGLLAMRNVFAKSFTNVDDMAKNEEKEEDKLFTILNLLLCYAKFGKLCYDNTKQLSDERIQAVVECIPFIDEVNATYETEEHYKAVNGVIAQLSPYIIDYLKTLPEDQRDENGSENESGNGSGNESSNSESNSGSSESNSSNGEGKVANQEMEKKLNQIAKVGGTANNEQSEEESEGNTPLAGSGNNSSTPSGQKPQGASDESTSEPNEIPQPDEESVRRSMEEAKKLLDEMAEKEASSELEEEKQRSLQEENRTFNYADIHEGVTCEILREKEVVEYAKEAWEEIKPKINMITKATVKNLKQILKDRRSGSVMRGLYFGKTIAPVSYSRHDKKYFQNKKLPTDAPTLSVCVLIDESGSMDGRKIEYAKLTALVIYQFCMELGIRVCILGHTSSSGHVRIQNYCDYNGSFDNNDIYRICQIRAKSCNRDGYALKYAVSHLRKEQSDVKLCFVISDGAPADSGYSGSRAYEDIKNVKKDANRHGIEVIAAAIDEDKEDIKDIYGEEAFLDITNLDNLPKAITDKIKKYLPKI